MTSQSYAADEFWQKFTADLERAKAHVVIQSPYLHGRRLAYLAKCLRELTARGVVVCVYIQRPTNWHRPENELSPDALYSRQELKVGIQLLQSWNIHVNLRPKIHGKLATIDEQILWEGSLNILSHHDAPENMRRLESSCETKAIIEKHALHQCAVCTTNLSNYFLAPSHPNKLGELLAKQRCDFDISQRRLAAKCGVPPIQIRRIESRKSRSFDIVLQVSQLDHLLVPQIWTLSVVNLLQQLSAHHAK